MTIFGLTGGSGTGKSSAAKIFREKGVYVIDADIAARNVVKKGSDCLGELGGYFGKVILNSDGTLNRAKLAEIAFSNDEERRMLNKITHKYIKNEIEKELQRENPKIAAIDGAVIIGSPIEAMCAFTVSVLADRDIRLRRILERDRITTEAAALRLDAQADDEFYIKHSRYVIYNNGSFEELGEQINKIFEEFGFEQNI